VTAEVIFFFGLGSRYSYLASTQIAALENETGCSVTWLPMASGALMHRRGQNPFASRDGDGNWSGASVSEQYNEQYRRTDLARWAALYEVPYNEPLRPLMDANRRTLYCVAAEMLGAGTAYCRAMFKSMYVDGIAVSEGDCAEIALQTGLDPDALRHEVDSGASETRHNEIIALALDLNVFGVPTFVVGRELFWGNDRLVLLRRHLKQSSC